MESPTSQKTWAYDHPTASSSLLSKVKSMDATGWGRLVSTFGPIVYVWCRTSKVPESEVPDLVQNVFVSVAHGIGDFHRTKEHGSFRSWLATITRNQVRDHFRRRSRQFAAEGGTDAMVSLQLQAEDLDSTICADTADGPLLRRVLSEVRTEFGEPNWNAFWMTTIDGKSASETANLVGISIASVYQSKSRILRRLRQRYSELE